MYNNILTSTAIPNNITNNITSNITSAAIPNNIIRNITSNITSANYTLSGHTHLGNNITISDGNGNNILLIDGIQSLQQEMDNIKDFLKFKNIIVDDEEYEDFVESKKVMKRIED